MERLSNIIREMSTICGLIAEALVFLLMLLVTAEIIGRRVFGIPIPGHVETAILALILILYLGVAYTQLERGHIRVELFISRLKEKKKEIYEALIDFICLIPSVLMLLATAEKALVSVQNQEFITGVINFPVWPSRCAVAFGFVLLSFTLLIQICDHLIAAFDVNKVCNVKSQ